MSTRLNFGIELADVRGRCTLPARYGPYWEVLSYGRALGYQRIARHRTFWVARIRLQNGKYRQSRIGQTNDRRAADGINFFSYQEALHRAVYWFAHPAQSKAATDTFPVGVKLETNSCPIGDLYTVGHAIRDYLEWKKLAAAHSHYVTLISYANYHILPRLGTMPLKAFNGTHLQEFIKDVLSTPPKPGNSRPRPKRPITSLTPEESRKRKKSVNALIGMLRQSIRMAWENGHFDNERAWRCIRHLPNVTRPRILALNRAECRRLLAVCAPDLQELILGALYTGCRSSELLLMDVSHFKPESGGLSIPPVKTTVSRFVFLPDEGLRFFARLVAGKRPGDPIFTRACGRRWYDTHRHHFKLAVLRAGLPPAFCFHGLRHTYASQLVQAGTPIIVVSVQLGHVSTTQVSRTYGHLAPQIREAEIRQRFTPVVLGRQENVDAEPCTARRPLYATINALDAAAIKTNF